MAKTYRRHYEITRADVLYALLEWLSGESGQKNGHRIAEEYGSIERLVEEIYVEIRERRLRFRPIRRYLRLEPTNGKVREIGIEEIKQQICDYLVVTLLEEMYDAKIGFYQVAAAKGKGQKLCRKALRRWVRKSRYHVKGDVRKCYPSTRHDVVLRVYRKLVGSADILYVIERLLETYTKGGLEIGSYFSLKTMQLVLSFGYHHVEGLYKVRRGKRVSLVTHQIWHMDDMLLISASKRDLKMAMRSLQRYLKAEFGLDMKGWKVSKTGDVEPLDLGGWVTREERCTLRSGTFLRGTRSFAGFRKCSSPYNARRCASYWGWFVHGDNSDVMNRRRMGSTFAHARAVVSRDDRRRNVAKDAERQAA